MPNGAAGDALQVAPSTEPRSVDQGIPAVNDSFISPLREVRRTMATVALDQNQTGTQTRAFVIAWGFTVLFYFLEYAVRSSPAVMIPELESSFHTTALGISAILGAYYYTYSTMSLVAGAALDHLGAKRTVPVGAATPGGDAYA